MIELKYPFHDNRICELLGIRYPIIEGGMAQIGEGTLAAAISEAGGLGQIAISGLSPNKLHEEIELATSKTTLPIGINIPISGHFSANQYFDVIKEKKRKSLLLVCPLGTRVLIFLF